MKQEVNCEYIDMYQVNEKNFWVAIEHIARYRYADWFCKKRRYRSVLDIACSNGYGSNLLSQSVDYVVGVDRRSDLIDFAAHKASKATKFVVCDVDSEDLYGALDNEQFELIVSFETFEHVRRPIELLKQFKRCLKSGGRVIVSVPNGEFEPMDEQGSPINTYHKHVFDLCYLEQTFCDTGFEVEFVLGQSLINGLMRKHNTYCSRNIEKAKHTTSNFHIDEKAIDYYINMFGYPEKDDLENSYVRIYILKHK